jgi:hypothetical protein
MATLQAGAAKDGGRPEQYDQHTECRPTRIKGMTAALLLHCVFRCAGQTAQGDALHIQRPCHLTPSTHCSSSISSGTSHTNSGSDAYAATASESTAASVSAGNSHGRQLQQAGLFADAWPPGCSEGRCVAAATGPGLRCSDCKNRLGLDMTTGSCGE